MLSLALSTLVGLAAAGNPFSAGTLYANSFYASEVAAAIPQLSDPSLAAKASAVAKTPSFYWLDVAAKVPNIADLVSDAKTQITGSTPILPLVVYDLPDRDCAAASSNGELSSANGGQALYFKYIDAIKAQISAATDVNFILVIEPDSLANLVTNLSVQKCATAAPTYKACVNYAITQLNMPNVAMYLDAGHGGWLGWPANLAPAAQLFAETYKNANSPASVRGLATNVANYNAWTIATAPSYTTPDPNYDESLYIHALSPALEQAGWSGATFITDTSRNGVQPTRQQQWGDWCNVAGTGFGARPSANTGDALLDAFVWVKPGGECDGTSNSSAPRFDYHCASSDALQPAPQAGTWFQAYFEQLVKNANPSF